MHHICTKCKTEITFCLSGRTGSIPNNSTGVLVESCYNCPKCKNKISYMIYEAIEVYSNFKNQSTCRSSYEQTKE